MNAVAVIAERLLGRADALADELTAAIRRAEPSYDAVPRACRAWSVRRPRICRASTVA